MSLLTTVTNRLNDLKCTFVRLPRWKQITIGVVSFGIVYKTYASFKPKQTEDKAEYYPNVPHYKAKMVVNCNNKLGECCIWDDRKQLVCWIDNNGSKFWTFDPKTNKAKSYDLPEDPGSFALCKDGSILICFKSGPAFYDLSTGKFSKKLFKFEPDRRSVMNDGRCDKYGRFVVGGVMDFHLGATNIFGTIRDLCKNIYMYKYGKRSSIYRIDEDLSIQHIVGDIMCANSICFGLDGTIMYFTDSFKKGIRKLNYFEDKKIPTNNQVFSDKYKGFADGACIDANGNLWSAQFGNGTIGCFDKNGDIIMVIDVPEKHVTCCCFGGEKLDTLFVNTLDGSMFGIKDTPKDVGNLYAVKLENVKGCKENRFKGTAPSGITLSADEWE